MPTRHTYTNELAPTNTGSLLRPARFNLRLTCSARGRTHAVLDKLKKAYGVEGSFADVWEERALMILEHHVRDLEVGDKAVKDYTRSKAEPIPAEDYQRARYEQLRLKFDPKARTGV